MTGFTDINDVLLNTTPLDHSIALDSLQSSQATAIATIQSVIPSAVLDAIEADTTEDEGLKSKLDDMLKYLHLALANRIMFNYLPFWTVNRNNTEQRLYKHQVESLKDNYIRQFWSAMDSLINLLDTSATDKFLAEWLASDTYQGRKNLLIKSAKEFTYYFNIAGSSYFFSQIQFLIRETADEQINTRIGSIATESKEEFLKSYKDIIGRSLCYYVMARAVTLFDLTELPESLRKDITSEYSTPGSMMQKRETLITSLTEKANKYFSALENAVAKTLNTASDTEDYNNENDKFFFM